ncbi:hypothetical protein DFH08DRAFT_1042453 [Mycena albidolilacea]|uniref:Uncharacterized protein n=1 Tax=Mycena albidolilacea TaxID=1033008 RepID=A0AAD7AH71_9AGAR|nr:hypothetical protein DFH08DRAFT_1042453 [Mycena albidolilacea]
MREKRGGLELGVDGEETGEVEREGVDGVIREPEDGWGTYAEKTRLIPGKLGGRSCATREGQWGSPPLINPSSLQERERDTGETGAPLKSAPARLLYELFPPPTFFAAAVMHVPPARPRERAGDDDTCARSSSSSSLSRSQAQRPEYARGVSMAQGTAKKKIRKNRVLRRAEPLGLEKEKEKEKTQACRAHTSSETTALHY